MPEPDPSGCVGAIQSVFTEFDRNCNFILRELRAAAGSKARIVTMTYYNPVPYCALGHANPAAGPFVDWVLEGGTLPGVGTLAVGYNDLIEMISAQFGATPAETFGVLGAGAAFHDAFAG